MWYNPRQMMLSVHLADVGVRTVFASLRRPPTPDQVPGLRYATAALTAPLNGGLLPSPAPGRLGLIAAWDDDAALDGFLGGHPLAKRLESGWHVRLEPLRASGTWSPLPELETYGRDGELDEPVAVVTFGRLRLSQSVRFLRANLPAADAAVADPAMIASTGLARPPWFLSTFSLWRTNAAMCSYAYGGSGDAHAAVIRAHRERPFHSESIFARFRPYRSRGSWDGRDPLAEVA